MPKWLQRVLRSFYVARHAVSATWRRRPRASPGVRHAVGLVLAAVGYVVYQTVGHLLARAVWTMIEPWLAPALQGWGWMLYYFVLFLFT